MVGRRICRTGRPALDVIRAGRSRGSPSPARLRFALAEHVGAATGLLVPLRSRGEDLGVLVLFDRIGAEREFSADDRLALESFAASAATAVMPRRTSPPKSCGARSLPRRASAAAGRASCTTRPSRSSAPST